MSDEHLNETVRQCMNATPLGRLSLNEAVTAVRWLEDNGHVTRTGIPLQQPRQAPRAIAHKPDGTRIYDPGADHSTHQTLTMQTGKAG